MQLAARVLRLAPVPIRRLGLRAARTVRLRNEPPAAVRWVHGGRLLMRKPLGGSRRIVTLQDLGAVGDFIGGIGVIVSLLYLARQIRASSRIERLNARYAVSQAISSAFSRIDEDPELHRVWVAAAGRGEELTEEDRERLGRFLYRYFAQLSLAYGYSEIDPGIEAGNEIRLLRFLRLPAVQGWWSRQRAFFAEPFRSEVDRLLATLDSQ